MQYETVSRTKALLCFVSDRKVDCLKTVAVAVLNCKQNVSFIVFCKVVYFTNHFCFIFPEENCCCKFVIVNFFQEIFNPRFIMIKIYRTKLAIDIGTFIC